MKFTPSTLHKKKSVSTSGAVEGFTINAPSITQPLVWNTPETEAVRNDGNVIGLVVVKIEGTSADH